MTRVDFYILSEQSSENRYHFACRLAEKAYRQGRRVYIHTASPDEARHLDRLLWTFRDGSFVPHGCLPEADPAVTPVLIGHDGNAGDEQDVLINLGAEPPAFFSRFERVAEPLDNDPAVKASGRDRFRYYRERGYPLETHNINP